MRENLCLGFPTSSDTNWAVQPQKMDRGLKFRIYELEGLYILCCENKGADQLRSFRWLICSSLDCCLSFIEVNENWRTEAVRMITFNFHHKSNEKNYA